MISPQNITLEVIKERRKPVDYSNGLNGHIYFLFDEDEVVYVGQTTQGESRVFLHRSASEGAKYFTSYTMIECPINELDEAEGYWIGKLCPRLNKNLGLTKGYYSRTHAKIKSSFPGWALNYLVENHSIRIVQLENMKNPRYHLEDLHEAAIQALAEGKLRLIENLPGHAAKYEYISKLSATTTRQIEMRDEKRKALIERALNLSPSDTVGSEPREELFIKELYSLISHQVHNGYQNPYWVGKTKNEWIEHHFPTWSVSTLQRTIQKLLRLGAIIETTAHNNHPLENMRWYSINYKEFPNLNIKHSKES